MKNTVTWCCSCQWPKRC